MEGSRDSSTHQIIYSPRLSTRYDLWFKQLVSVLETFAQVLALARQLNSAEEIATALNNMATVYVSQQRYADAERTALEADAVQQPLRLPWQAKAVLVDVYLATRRYDKALALLQERMPTWQQSDHDRFLWLTQHGLALQGLGRLSEATTALLQAVTLAEDLRQRVTDRLAFFGNTAQGGRIRAYRALVMALAERAMHGETMEPALAAFGKNLGAAAFAFAEATKGRVLIEALAASARHTEQTAIPGALRAEEERLQGQLAAMQEQWGATYQLGEAAFKSMLERKQGLDRDLHLLRTRLRQEYPRYAALHYPQPLPAHALPLKAQEMLLEYAIGEDATYLFRLKPGGVDKLWRLPIRREELERQVRAFLLPLQQPGGSGIQAFSPRQGHSLYTLLLAEALQDVPADTQIILVPDGILGSLPFESLVTAPGRDVRDAQYVGEAWKIRYAQSATVFAFLRTLAPSTAGQAFLPLAILSMITRTLDTPPTLAVCRCLACLRRRSPPMHSVVVLSSVRMAG